MIHELEHVEAKGAARPKCRKISIKGLRPEHVRIQEWYWVAIHAICDELCGIVIRLNDKPTGMPSVSLASDFFDRYGLLCHHENKHALLTWVSQGQRKYVVDGPERPENEYAYGVVVPVGFSNAVLNLAEQGFVRVSVPKCPQASIRYLVAHHLDGTTCIIERKEKYGLYKISS